MNNKLENKYKHWMFYIQSVENSKLPSESDLKTVLESYAEVYVFQKEKATAEHYQGCLRTLIRKRKQTVINELADKLRLHAACVQVDNLNGTWEQAKAYCTKEETSVGETYTNELTYSGKDVEVIDDKSRRFPWQSKIIEKLVDEDTGIIKDTDDRTIIWVHDPKGGVGKSKLVKWMCARFNSITKISFGTSNQLRSAIIAAGIHKIYFIDIPRTLGTEDSLNSVITNLEDLKNGFCVSAFYGKHQTLMLDPPHIVVFSNMLCPQKLMSQDRWEKYVINFEKDLRAYDEMLDVYNKYSGEADGNNS